jgi:tRNA threonylcarbamoyladenosine biosynthesis protein TsaE
MSENTISLITHSAEETEDLGATLSQQMPQGTVVALYGDLAAGKTCLVRGMAQHFGPVENVHSPTFTLVNIYGESPRQLFHLDLYRLGTVEELYDLGFEELFEPQGICVVEWAERAEGVLPVARVDIHLEHAGGDKRKIKVIANCELPAGWEDSLRSRQPVE